MIAKNERSMGIDEKRNYMLAYDLATHFVMAYPIGFKDIQEAYLALKHYAGQQKILRFYSARGGELISVAKLLRWLHDKSLPYLHSNSGIIERRNRIILEGTRTILMRSGLPIACWTYTVVHFSFAQNIATISGDPTTAPYYK